LELGIDLGVDRTEDHLPDRLADHDAAVVAHPEAQAQFAQYAAQKQELRTAFGASDTLYFTAVPNNETNGLFGTITLQ
jgi:hypothetical protein